MSKYGFSVMFGVLLAGSLVQAKAQTSWPGDQLFPGTVDIGSISLPSALNVYGVTKTQVLSAQEFSMNGGILEGGTLALGGIASGTDSIAVSGWSQGAYSLALWGHSVSDHTVAINASAFGVGSVAVNDSTTFGDHSVALNDSHAYEGSGMFVVNSSYAEAIGAAAINHGYAKGENSLATTYGISIGVSSTAIAGGVAEGSYSVAVGPDSFAGSYGSTVVGRNNASTGSENRWEWVEADPLFVVGNGTGVSIDPVGVRERDAFVIYKDGSARFAKRQGDISMGEFGNVGSGD